MASSKPASPRRAWGRFSSAAPRARSSTQLHNGPSGPVTDPLPLITTHTEGPHRPALQADPLTGAIPDMTYHVMPLRIA